MLNSMWTNDNCPAYKRYLPEALADSCAVFKIQRQVCWDWNWTHIVARPGDKYFRV